MQVSGVTEVRPLSSTGRFDPRAGHNFFRDNLYLTLCVMAILISPQSNPIGISNIYQQNQLTADLTF